MSAEVRRYLFEVTVTTRSRVTVIASSLREATALLNETPATALLNGTVLTDDPHSTRTSVMLTKVEEV